MRIAFKQLDAKKTLLLALIAVILVSVQIWSADVLLVSRDMQMAATIDHSHFEGRSDTVHVVYSADQNDWVGMLSSMNSIWRNARRRERVQFHVVVSHEERPLLANAVDCLFERELSMRVHIFDFQTGAGGEGAKRCAIDLLGGGAARDVADEQQQGDVRNLFMPHNWVRFCLAHMLPIDRVPKAIWIDADTLVLGAIDDMFDSALTDASATAHALAAVVKSRGMYWRMQRKRRAPNLRWAIEKGVDGKASLYGRFDLRPNSTLVRLLPELEGCGVDKKANVTKDCEYFNAGMVMMRLDLWKQRRLDAEVRRWVDLNDASTPHMFPPGRSQLPFTFAFFVEDGRRLAVDHLDEKWHLSGLGKKIDGGKEALKRAELDAELANGRLLLHWAGPRKPWLVDGNFKDIWQPYAIGEHCVFREIVQCQCAR